MTSYQRVPALLLLMMMLILTAVPAAALPDGGVPATPYEVGETARCVLADGIIRYMNAAYAGGAPDHPERDDLCTAALHYPAYPRRITDSSGKLVTIYAPVERAVILNSDLGEAVTILGAGHRVAGVSHSMKKYHRLMPGLCEKNDVRGWSEPDIEAVLACSPDIVFTYSRWPAADRLDDKLPLSVRVVRLDFYKATTLRDEMITLGYLLDRSGKAEEYAAWHDTYTDLIGERVSEIREDERVRVYLDSGGGKTSGRGTYSTGTGLHDLCTAAGGANIAEGYVSGYADVETEWILKEHPDVIIGISYKGGYETDDAAAMADYYDEIMGQPGFQEIRAVTEGRVHIIANAYAFAPGYPAALAQMAKWLYPGLFEDLDPVAIHQEYIDRFVGIDYNVSEEGAFIYPRN